MPRTTWTKHAFSAGELSPNICQSRKDIPLHAQGVSQCKNLIPLKSGSLIARPNVIPYTDCILPENATRIIPFNLTNGVYVLLVFGQNKLSIIALGSSSSWNPHTSEDRVFDTPYLAWEAKKIEYAVYGPLMVLVHKNHPPYQLIYTGDGFKFSKMEFSPPPWLGDGITRGSKSNANMSIERHSKDDQNSFLITASERIFTASDKGRSIRLGCIPSGWKAKKEYPKNAFMVAGEKVYKSLVGGISGENWDIKSLTGVTYVKDGTVQWMVAANLSSSSSNSSSNSRVSPYYVWGLIEEVYDERTVRVRSKSQNSFLPGDDVTEWYLSAWTVLNTFPSHVTFYQNRLVLTGGKDDELSVYLSGYDNFYDFSPDGEYGCLDLKKALSVAVTDSSVSEIKWIHPLGEGVLVGCDSSLWLLSIKLRQGLDIDFRRISGSGVYSCSPMSVGDCLFFVCGAGRRIKSVSGSTEQGFKFLEVTQFAEHLFKSKIDELVYQEEPNSIIWVLSSTLLGCRFSSDGDGDFAWHKHNIGGGRCVLSLASFPSVDFGETSVWVLLGGFEDTTYKTTLERLGDFSSTALRSKL